MEEKKLKSLLKFYKKKNIDIEIDTNLKGGLSIKGKIIKLRCRFRKYIILQSLNNSQIKIFFEDINDGGIIPIDFINKSENNKKVQNKRSPIPPKLRYDVLRRDKFVCQYCGACGPDVELEIDHKIPVSRGGTDNIENLITSCFDCNRGKGDLVQ